MWLQPSLPSAPHLAQTAPAAAADAKIAAWLPWLAANETTAVPSSSILKSIHSAPTPGSRRSRASSPAALSSSSLSSTTRRFRATLRCCWPRVVVPLLPLPLLRGIRPSTQSSSVPSSPVQSSTGGKKKPDIPWISKMLGYPGISWDTPQCQPYSSSSDESPKALSITCTLSCLASLSINSSSCSTNSLPSSLIIFRSGTHHAPKVPFTSDSL